MIKMGVTNCNTGWPPILVTLNKICFTPTVKTQELKYIQNVFEHKDGYHKYVIEKTINNINYLIKE